MSQERWTNVLNHPVQKPMLNRATQENYQPGSIMKILTGLAELEMEALDPREQFNVMEDPERPGKGCYYVGHRKIKDTVAAGPYNFKKALMHSSNSYFIHHGLKPGVLQKMILLGEKFHLGERTGILPRQETAGEFPDQSDLVRRWQAGDHDAVCEYVLGDVRMTTAIVEAIEARREIAWVTSRGTTSRVAVRELRPVESCLQDPLPDQSWMDAPLSDTKFTGWLSTVA